MTTLTFTDTEFGTVTVRINPRARRVVLRTKNDQSIHLTIPHQRHLSVARRLLDDSRESLRKKQHDPVLFSPGQAIGNQQLLFQARAGAAIRSTNRGDTITIRFPMELDWDSPEVQAVASEAALKALRTQAKLFLPPRLRLMSEQCGIAYNSVRITSATTRWGSCTQDARIHLSIWLMLLPIELIDYVLCHELCHTLQHNHSPQFWQEVERRIPDYKQRRTALKAYNTFWQNV